MTGWCGWLASRKASLFVLFLNIYWSFYLVARNVFHNDSFVNVWFSVWSHSSPITSPSSFHKYVIFSVPFFFFWKEKGRIFTSISTKDISLLFSFCCIFIWFWYKGNTDLIKRVVPFLHDILMYVMVSKALVFFFKGLVYQSLGLEFFFLLWNNFYCCFSFVARYRSA